MKVNLTEKTAPVLEGFQWDGSIDGLGGLNRWLGSCRDDLYIRLAHSYKNPNGDKQDRGNYNGFRIMISGNQGDIGQLTEKCIITYDTNEESSEPIRIIPLNKAKDMFTITQQRDS